MLCTVDVLVTWCVVSCNEHVGGRPPSLWRTTRNKTQDLSRGIVHACARHRSLYGKLTIGLEDGYLVHLLTSESLSSKVVRLNGLALVPAPDGSPPPFEALWVKGPVTLPPVSVAFVQPASAGEEEACA